MTPLVPALAGMALVGGVLLLVAGLRPVVVDAAPRPGRGVGARLRRLRRRTVIVAAVSAGAGLVVAVATGWLIALVVFPLGALGLPALLGDTGEARTIGRLEALAEWTRNLAGVLRVGAGLEGALADTLRSTPAAIRPEVSRLVARVRARWDVPEALRAFAAEFDDVTGDLVAATLILASRKRADGLAQILSGLAESVAAEVAARRRLEADRAKPRQTARIVTLITVVTLAVLVMSGQALEPYRSPLGQLILAGLLGVYVGLLVVMRRMSTPKPIPRFIAETGGAS